MRMYDPRICRFPSVDPITAEYPWYTPYQFAGNKPIQNIDLDGLEDMPTTGEGNSGDWGGSEYKGDDKFRELNISINGIEGGDAKRMARTVNGVTSSGATHPNASQGTESGCGVDGGIYHCGTSMNNYKDEGWYTPESYEGLFLKTLQGQVLPMRGWIGWIWADREIVVPGELGSMNTKLGQIATFTMDLKITVDDEGYIYRSAPAYAIQENGLRLPRFTIYTGMRDGLRYFGKAKYIKNPANLMYRYSANAIRTHGYKMLRGLQNIPNNEIALGIEYQIMKLNGWAGARLNRLYPVLSNKISPTNNLLIQQKGLEYLNKNIPNWQELFKFTK